MNGKLGSALSHVEVEQGLTQEKSWYLQNMEVMSAQDHHLSRKAAMFTNVQVQHLAETNFPGVIF